MGITFNAPTSFSADSIASLIKNPFSTSVPPNGERPVDFPGGFQIIEYVNGVPVSLTNPELVIRLVGNLMPMQPFQWGGEQRLTKEYYAGNREPAVHVLGSKESNLTIKGRFKDKKIKDVSLYGASYQTVLAIDNIRKRGNLVKFGMHGMSADWLRYGFIEKVDWKMNKLSWIDYEIEFLVISENQPINNYFAAPEKQSSQAVNQNLVNALASFQSSPVPTTMPISLAGLLNNGIGLVAKGINLVTGFVSTILTTGQDIANSANRALGLIQNARTQLAVFNRQFQAIEHSFNNLGVVGRGFTLQSFYAAGFQTPQAATQVANTYQNIAYTNELQANSYYLNTYLAQMQAQFEALIKTIPVARYRVQLNDTLQNISIRFYQTADYWTNIYDHNQLQSTTLTPGQVLEIPHI